MQDEELFRDLEIGQRFFHDHEPLIAGLMYGIAKTVYAHRDWTDRDLILALTAITRVALTRANSGLIVQESTPNPVQQSLSDQIESMIAEYRKLEVQHLGYSQLKDGEVVRALVFLVRMAHSRTNGRRKSRAFLDSLRSQFPVEQEHGPAPSASDRGLIIP